jgi:hypothetical protein
VRLRACIGLLVASPLTSMTHANVSCSGSVSFLGSDNTGAIFVNIGYGVWGVCNVSQAYTQSGVTVSPDSCKTWYAALLAAQRAGTQVYIYMFGSTDCSAYGNWVNLGPYFLQPQ